MTRTGQAPKTLLPFLCPELKQKIISRTFVDPANPGVEHRFEVLAPHQQQWISFGDHPVTKEEYVWDGGSLRTVHRKDLIELTLDQVHEIEKTFGELCIQHGLVPKGGKREEGEPGGEQSGDGPDDFTRAKSERRGTSIVDDFNSRGPAVCRDELLELGFTFGSTGLFKFQHEGVAYEVKSWRYKHPGTDKPVSIGMYRNPGNGFWYVKNFSTSIDLDTEGSHLISHVLAVLLFSGDYNKLIPWLREKGFRAANERSAQDDFADFATGAEGGQPGSGQQARKKRRGFDLLSAADILKQRAELRWIVEELLPEGCLSSIYGKPGSYKTYVALDIALSVTTGIPWHGHPIEQGMVVYICGEGFHGLGGRIRAWMIEHGLKDATDIPFYISTSALPLNTEAGIKSLAAKVDALISNHGEPRLVVLDTLARCNDGDENAASDMGRLVRNLDDYLPASTARLVLHHVGHSNQDRGRGSSAWHAALDTEFLLAQQDDRTIAMICTKAKDFPEWERPLTFKVKPVVINEDLDENVVLELTDRPTGGDKTRPSEAMDAAIKLLRSLTIDAEGVDRVRWRNACIFNRIYRSKRSFDAAVARMRQRGLIKVKGTKIIIPGGNGGEGEQDA